MLPDGKFTLQVATQRKSCQEESLEESLQSKLATITTTNVN